MSWFVWRALVVGLLPILMSMEVPILHQHSGHTPAFYDGACPLAQYLASRSEASPTPQVDLPRPLPALERPQLQMSPVNVAAPVFPFEPRGPPRSV